jgi:hypothetical protein
LQSVDLEVIFPSFSSVNGGGGDPYDHHDGSILLSY